MTPLSQSQLGIFYACQNAEDGNCNYQIPFLYSLPETVDGQRLVRAFDAFAAAHPYINSRIVLSEGVPMIEEGPYEGVEIIESEDITDPYRDYGKAMDLLKDKLYRAALINTASGRYFLIDFHHIIFDGSSLQTFVDQMQKAYDGQTLEKESMDGGDMARSEYELRSGKEFQKDREWYIKEFSAAEDLDSVPVPPELGENEKGMANSDFKLDLEKDLLPGICKKHNTRKSVVFTAAWAKTMANYTADYRAIFLTIHHGRNEENKGSVTMAVRTLPVYSEMPTAKPIGQWLRELDAQMEGTRAHRAYSYADLHEDLGINAEILFAYQGRLAPATDFPIRLGNDTIVCSDLRRARPGTVLDGQLFENSDGSFTLRLTYDHALYSDVMIEGLKDSYCAVLRSMGNAKVIGDLEAVTPEQAAWLDSINGAMPDDKAEPLVDAFRSWAAKTPDAGCCVFEDRRYSYAQIDRMSDSLAADIQNYTKGRREVVSFMSERDEMMLILPLAVAKAGCTYQPLDPSYPKERLNFMIKDSGAALLICPQEYRDLVDEYKGHQIILNGLPEGSRKPSATPYNPDDVFILLYTSGTTGTPKGVMLTNKNVALFVRENTRISGMDSSSRYLSYASYGFDAFMQDLWTTMSNGICLHIISEDIRYDLPAIKDYIEKEGITHAFMTTQVATQLAVNYPSIKGFGYLATGGEKLVSINPPEYSLLNDYGPTETTCYVTCYKVLESESNIPIGSATENVHAYVVNKDGKRLPPCASGELWIAGPQVAKGYLNRPDKTAEVFIDNPFEGGVCSRIYRTGDFVLYREDGLLEYVGRKDGQVKIRGFRIELKEVEAVIREFPSVREVTVQAFDLESGGKAIAAYVVPEGTLDVEALNSFIGQRKPPYMVPAVTMQLDAIPLNVNGKVDRKRLPEPVMQTAADAKLSALAPHNILEEELVELVGHLTDCKDFPPSLPLAQAGLSSIASLKLSMELYKKYGVNISSRDLSHEASILSIENEILGRLLGAHNSASENTRCAETNNVVKSAEDCTAPLSNAQMGVYLECLKKGNSTIYNVPEVFTFPESVNSSDIQAAVSRVLELHPVLFITIDSSVDPPVQRAPRQCKAVVEISDRSVEELKKDFVQPFDLENGPLYRAVVSGHTLFLDAHHLVVDGSSVSMLAGQICTCLEGGEVQAETCDYFKWSREEKEVDNTAIEAFLKDKLSSVPDSSCIPADLHGREDEGHTAQVRARVDHRAVSDFARILGVTPASVYLAAFEYLTARYSNSEDVCLCTVSSGRGDVRISDTVGMFVNTLVQCSRITGASIRDFIHDVARALATAIEHENYPFAKIADEYGISAETVFVYEVGVLETYSVGGTAVKMESLELPVPKFKFTLLVEETPKGVVLTAQYNDALYSRDMVSRLLDSLKQVITNMIANPNASIRKLSIVSGVQHFELTNMNSGGFAPMPERVFHHGIRRWAISKPGHTAVIATDGKLTYSELDALANRIANALIDKGLKKGDPVIALLPRRCSTIACLYGIMKAGGAFIPCDPDYPTERIKLIADDSDAPFVVAESRLAAKYGKRGLDIAELLSFSNRMEPEVAVTKRDLAYMIYTSGSTGRPKGVRMLHGNITTLLNIDRTHQFWPIVHNCERICSVATISFDAFVSEFALALFHGRTLVFPDEKITRDPIALAGMLAETASDYFGCTSSRMLQYLELPEFAACMARMKVVLQGGEKFSETLLVRLRALNGNMYILNGYGPTEISICCNCSDLRNSKTINVGRPLPNYTEWILDRDNNELPVGVTGELCVGGESVSPGYNKLPELTAQKFITYGGMRAFKTGDYARWLPDGTVEILGRTDNQVKLRGLRIELGEVEGAISEVEGVKNVLVKICNLQGRDHLSAYFTADRKICVDDMKRKIGSTLTAYMVPTAYLQLDSFPMTPNGKIDYKHLPEPQLSTSSGEYVAPSSPQEQFYADCFARILQLDKVSATDSFFELGGTSLVVMKLVVMAQQEGYQLTYSDVFSHPSPRSLARLAAGTDSEDATDPDADVRNYDYSAINSLLKDNTLDNYLADSSVRPMKEILLTGSTGFLGIHILHYILTQYPEVKVHCLLRSHKTADATSRLEQLAFYYFESSFQDEVGKRLFIHEGDVTADFDIDAPIDTVFNCAALVKHFSAGNEINDVNIGGVKRCIDFCLRKKARLIQVSTTSISGAGKKELYELTPFTEEMLYVGQILRNQYLHSKIIGERHILDAVANHGLDAKIMRVGNLSPRSEDGEFQINFASNSFMGRLKVLYLMGVQAFSTFPAKVEFSPVDETARAICLLSATNSRCTVFHPYNTHVQMLGDVVRQMKEIDRQVRLVENDEFVDELSKAKSDDALVEKLSSMLAYEYKETGKLLHVIPVENNYTTQVLLRLGFFWPTTSLMYIKKFLQKIDGLGFFEN